MGEAADAYPALPYDLLEHVVPRFFNLADQCRLGRTCRRLAATWKLRVTDIELTSRRWPETEAVLLQFDHVQRLRINWAHFLGWRFLRRPVRNVYCSITDESVAHLRALRSLEIEYGRNIRVSDTGLERLTSLTDLRLTRIPLTGVTGRCLACLTALTRLDFDTADTFSSFADQFITVLTSLTRLRLRTRYGIPDSGLSCLTALTRLSLQTESSEMATPTSNKGIACLTSLTRLEIAGHTKFAASDLACLVSLRKLVLVGTKAFRHPDHWTHAVRWRLIVSIPTELSSPYRVCSVITITPGGVFLDKSVDSLIVYTVSSMADTVSASSARFRSASSRSCFSAAARHCSISYVRSIW